MTTNYVVCLDPGHGGHDSGAVWFGIKESDVNLAIAELTRFHIVNSHPDISCFLTRNDDSFIKLSDRPKKSNSIYADAFVSIHINGFSSASANGFETFIHDNASQDSAKLQDSIHTPLADLWSSYSSRDRGKKRANFYVIRTETTKAPAILVEFGFITNRADNELLKIETFLKENAVILGDAIVSFLRQKTA